jgi:hypothetical protein
LQALPFYRQAKHNEVTACTTGVGEVPPDMFKTVDGATARTVVLALRIEKAMACSPVPIDVMIIEAEAAIIWLLG